jgi:hypothetical protein
MLRHVPLFWDATARVPPDLPAPQTSHILFRMEVSDESPERYQL